MLPLPFVDVEPHSILSWGGTGCSQAYAKIASVPIEEVNVVNDRSHFASSVSVKKASFDGE